VGSGEEVRQVVVVDKPDFIGCVEIDVTRDNDAVLIPVFTEHVGHRSPANLRALQEAQKMFRVLGRRRSEIDLPACGLLAKSGARPALPTYVLLDVTPCAFLLAHDRPNCDLFNEEFTDNVSPRKTTVRASCRLSGERRLNAPSGGAEVDLELTDTAFGFFDA
jgi:hypothetical protein